MIGQRLKIASSKLIYQQVCTVCHLDIFPSVQFQHVPKKGLSLVLTMSELLNKSSLDSISIWLLYQMIFCCVYAFYYGCISPWSFSEIRHKITLNNLLQLKICENWSTVPFYHVGVTSACYVYKKKLSWWFRNQTFHDSTHKFWHFWWFCTQILENDCASSAFDLITILSVWSKWYRYQLGGNDDTSIPNATFSTV